MTVLRDFLDPRRDPFGPLPLGTLVLAGLILAGVAFASGFVVGRASTKYTQAYWAAHVPHGEMTVPIAAAYPPITSLPAPAAPTGSVWYQWLPPPDDQGWIPSCVAHQVARQLAYLRNWAEHTHGRTSSRLLYWFVTQGAWVGTYPEQYLPAINQSGTVSHRTWDWTPSPSQIGPGPTEGILTRALHHRYSVTETPISYNTGGMTGVYGIEYWVHRHRPVNIAVPFFTGPNANGLGDVNTDGGVVDDPANASRVNDIGGHDLSVTGYFRNRCVRTSAGRTCGVFIVSNNYGPQWGINHTTLTFRAGHSGYAMMTYRFVRDHAFAIDVLNLATARPLAQQPLAASPLPPWHQPFPATHPIAPPPPGTSAHSIGVYRGPWVRPGIRSVNPSGPQYDLSQIVDTTAARLGISAVGLLSVMDAECAGKTTSPWCDRYNGNPDTSFGCCQITPGTAGGFGVGDGSYSLGNIEFLRQWEDNPYNGVDLMARILLSYRSYLWHRTPDPCLIDFPDLDVAWNAGPGNPCWWLLHPSGMAYSNHLNYLEWWNIAIAVSSATNPYAPRPRRFPAARWGTEAPYQVGGRLRWAAQVWWNGHTNLGAVRGPGRWHRRGRYTDWRFVHGHIYLWPIHGWIKVVHR